MTLIIVLIGLQLADIVTTWLALRGGAAREANPVVRWFIERLGLVPGLVAAKLALVAPVLAVATASTTALWLGIALYAAVIVNNIIVLRRV